jgi:hypothetical protein
VKEPRVDNTMKHQETEEYFPIDEMTSDGEGSAQKEPEPTENLYQKQPSQKGNSRSSYFDGLAVGLGIGSITAFAIIWVSLFLSPMLPQTATYESLLATFIYPLIFMVGTGLVAITAGVVREYYPKNKL